MCLIYSSLCYILITFQERQLCFVYLCDLNVCDLHENPISYYYDWSDIPLV